jgi:hypothetical protein
MVKYEPIPQINVEKHNGDMDKFVEYTNTISPYFSVNVCLYDDVINIHLWDPDGSQSFDINFPKE